MWHEISRPGPSDQNLVFVKRVGFLFESLLRLIDMSTKELESFLFLCLCISFVEPHLLSFHHEPSLEGQGSTWL